MINMCLLLQVMQQISDHVRQQFLAVGAVHAQPAQNAPSTVSTYTRQPIGVAPPGCHHQSHPGLGHSPVHAADHHVHLAYATNPFRDTRLEPESFNGAHMSSGRPPSVLPDNMQGQQHASPQQLFASNHSLPPAQHQVFAPAAQPAVQHLQAQPTDASFASQSAAACRQPDGQVAAGLQHASPASGLHGVSPWHHNGPALPQSSSPLLYHPELAAAASSIAPPCWPGQPHSTMPCQHVAAVGAPLGQIDVTAQFANSNQPSGLVLCPDQSMLSANDPTLLVSPVLAPLGAGSSDPQVLLGTTACGATRHDLDSLAGQMPCRSVSAAMPATQEAVPHSAQHSPPQQQQSSSVQQPLLPVPAGRLAPSSLPAQQQPAVPGKSDPAPLVGPYSTGASAPPTAAGVSSLPSTVEQGQPATTSLVTAASCPSATCNTSALVAPTHSTGGISIHHPSAPGSTAVPSTHDPDSRPGPYTAPPADVMKPSVVPQRTAWPENALPAQQLTSPSVVPGHVTPLDITPQFRQITASYASTSNRSAACSLPLGVSHTGLPPEVASDGSFRFQPQTDCVQVPAGVCCTPVLRPRSQEVAYAGMSAAMYLLHFKGQPETCSASHALVLHSPVALRLSHLWCWMKALDICNSSVDITHLKSCLVITMRTVRSLSSQ